MFNTTVYAYKKSSPYASLKTLADDLKLLPVSLRTQQSYWTASTASGARPFIAVTLVRKD